MRVNMPRLESPVIRSLLLRSVLICGLGIIASLTPAAVSAQSVVSASAARDAADAEAASSAARSLSRLEADEKFSALYDRLHPDVQEIVPRTALVGWYEAEFATKRTEEMTIRDVEIGAWEWPVTGRRYERVAAISYTRPVWTGEDRTEVDGTIHLIEEDGAWLGLFGTNRESLAGMIAAFAPAETAAWTALTPDFAAPDTLATRAASFPDILHADVDRFWATQFAAAGRDYNPPDAVVGFAEPILTGCGRADPAMEAAFYCVIDETIYYSVDFRQTIEAGVGDFGWVVVVAHEWAHHIQFELGVDPGVALDRVDSPSWYALEQQADCLAGAYTLNAEAIGWLDPGDVEEAIFVTNAAGDPIGTPFDDPFAHGTGEDRVDAFLDGYDGSLAGCDLDL